MIVIDSSQIPARLRDYGKRKYGSMAEFARALGVKPQTLNAYLSGRMLPGKMMVKRLQRIGIDTKWLLFGETAEAERQNQRPVYARVSAGRGNIVSELPSSYEILPPGVKDNSNGYWLRVEGDSMFPALRDGQLVFVNPEHEVRDNDFAVVVWSEHEEGAIKQVHFAKEDIILTSINPLYKPLVFHRKDISMIARICFIKL